MSLIIKLDGVEVAMVSPGSRPTVININHSGRDQSALRVGQVMAGVVCLIFCWTNPILYTGVWTGIPLILTASLFTAHEKISHPGLLGAALLMNFVSLVLSIAGAFLFQSLWRYSNLECFVLLANLAGIYCCLQSFSSWRGVFPLKKMEQNAEPLLGAEPPAYEEKSQYLEKV